MANIEPNWSLVSDTNTILEGQELYVKLILSNSKMGTDNTTLTIDDNQYVHFTLKIKGTGTTLGENDFVVSIGEDPTQLENITDVETGFNKIYGTHDIKLTKKHWDIVTPTGSTEAFYIKLERPANGIWNSTETIAFNISDIKLVSLLDDQIASEYSFGEIELSNVTIKYDNSNDIWATPDLIVHGDQMYTIGAISYGAESRLFGQAFGKSRKYDPVLDAGSTDLSSRVFVPAYKAVPITEVDIPTKHITGKGTYFTTQIEDGDYSEEFQLYISDENNTLMKSGLKMNANGQILQTLLYSSDPVDAYIKYEIVPITDYYETEEDAFYVGKRFKAYQMWVAPTDTSTFSTDKPIPGHLYMLKDTKVYPYTVKEIEDSGDMKLLFEPDIWLDLGVYDARLGSKLIGNTRMFRILVNARTGDDISFETDENLGIIHVGEYFGHTVYPKIVASGDKLITYYIDYDKSPDDISKYNIWLSPNGMLTGTVLASALDFDSNDEINLEFDVVATTRKGLQKSQIFKIKIVRGLSENFLSAYVAPSVYFERSWFSMISSNVFDKARLYRASDPRYGLRTVPRMLIKENYVDPTTFDWESLESTKRVLRKNIINVESGAPVPDEPFDLVLGNYKIKSAVDNAGNILYDLLYREVLPTGTVVDLNSNPKHYLDYNNTSVTEIYGLRQNIYKAVGEDTRNLLTDPDDMLNRAITVKGIPGISDDMIDTLPRVFVHPYEEGNSNTKNYYPIIPVAYLEAGTGDSFFLNLMQSNEHKALLNMTFSITAVEFDYFYKEYERYVSDKFLINLSTKSLL